MHPLTDHLDRRCSEPVGYDGWPKADVVRGDGRVPSSDLLLRNPLPLRRLLRLAIRRRRLIKEKKEKEIRNRKRQK